MKLCLLIDDNMHWALIDLLLWYYFCIYDYSFFRGCFLVACYCCFQSYMQFFASRKRLALTESLFFGDLKIRFALLCCLCCSLIDCEVDETVLFELMITCTGLWLNCFVFLFLYALLKFSAAAFEWLALIAFKKSYVQFCASGKTSAGLWQMSLVFWRSKQWNYSFAISFFPFKIDFGCYEVVLIDWW